MSADKIASPILAAVGLGLIALFGIWAQEAWLAPSLGSAMFLQVFNPEQESARPYSVAVGQLIGAVAGFAGVFIAGAASVPAFMGSNELVYARAIAVAVAVLLAAAAQLACKATNPAGGATALVVAIGAESPEWRGLFHLVIGIALVTVLGEAARRIVLRLRGIHPR